MPEETNNPYAPAPIGRKRPERRKRNLLRQYISALLCFGAALMLFGAALMGFTVRMVPGEGSFIPPLFGVILAIAAMLLQLKGRAIWHASNQQL